MEKPSSTIFPEDILHEILKRLPSKTLCSFLSVCKSWHRLITSQAFISSNLSHNITTQSNTYMLLEVSHNPRLKNYHSDEFLFYPPHQTNNVLITKSLGEPSFVVNNPDKTYKVLGTCNGLICLLRRRRRNTIIILFNPSIQKFVSLAPFDIQVSNRRFNQWEEFGFGVDLTNGDYKVIRLCGDGASSSAEVYSLKTGNWVKINGVPSNIDHLKSWSQAYLNGRSHWIGKLVHGNEVVSFDFRDGNFRAITMPEQVANNEISMWSSTRAYDYEFKGECLAIVINVYWSFSIWVMKEYGVVESWTNIYNIDNTAKLGVIRFVGLIKNGKFFVHLCNQLECRDPHSTLASNIDINGSGLHAEKYMESLVLLEPHFSL